MRNGAWDWLEGAGWGSAISQSRASLGVTPADGSRHWLNNSADMAR